MAKGVETLSFSDESVVLKEVIDSGDRSFDFC